MKRWVVFIICLIFCKIAVPHFGLADCWTFESTFGATNVCGVVGNGALTADLSCRGELTVLRWPSPTYYDHLLYLSSNADNARKLPRFGALESMGAFWGLKLELADGSTMVSWLRDEPWQVQVKYLDTDSAILVHRYFNDALKLQATSYSLVDPELDIFAWHLEVERQSGSPVKKASAIFYANLSPCNKKLPYIPVTDWLLDTLNDFAAIYLGKEDAILHFKPQNPSYDELDALMKASDSERPQKVTDLYYSLLARPGIYLALGFEGGNQSFQIGKDDTDTCSFLNDFIKNVDWEVWGLPNPLDDMPVCLSGTTDLTYKKRGWTYQPQSAYANASKGALSQSIAAAVQADEAVERDILAEGQTKGEATVYITASDRPDSAVKLLSQARNTGWTALYYKYEDFWRDWTCRAWLPDTDDELVKSFYKRTLITLKISQDRSTGAIPAALATQPPYFLNWPRDASFNNYLLDMAGYHEEAEKNDLFFASVIREHDFLIAPKGTFEMNYFADGTPGGPLFFEIDNAGLILWQMCEHAKFLSGDKKAAYLEAVYPAIKLGAEGLVECRDPNGTGLQCQAWEDDDPRLRQTLRGASPVLAALKNAVQIAQEVGEEETVIARWQARIDELTAAIMENFYTEGVGFQGGLSGRSYILWPAEIFDYGDPRWDAHIAGLLDEAWGPILKELELFSYDGKGAWSVAKCCRERNNEACLTELQDWAKKYIALIATLPTLHVGEVFCRIDTNGDGQFDTVESRVSIPMHWQAVIPAATALVAFGPVEQSCLYAEPQSASITSSEEEGHEESGCGCLF